MFKFLFFENTTFKWTMFDRLIYLKTEQLITSIIFFIDYLTFLR